MGLFTRDPRRKAEAARARWLGRVPEEATAVAEWFLASLPEGWEVGMLDRERFSPQDIETYGVAVAGPAGEHHCGVGLTAADAITALHRRMGGQLDPASVWAPPLPANLEATTHGSFDQLEGAGWQMSVDGETYSMPQVRVTGAAAHRDGSSLLAVVVGGGERDAARAALADLVAGRLAPTEHWAPI